MPSTRRTNFRGTAMVVFLESQVPSEIAAKLRDVAARCQAIAMVAVDHPTVTAAVVELKERRACRSSRCSPISHRACAKAMSGSTTARPGAPLPGSSPRRRSKPGKVVVFVGSHRFHGQEMREIGFRSYFREYAPEFELVETMVNLEARRIAHEATLDLLQRFPDLAGFYVAGGGMEGAISALREEGMAGRMTVVCNELTPESRAALADNIVTVVIATPIERLSRELVVADGAGDRGRRRHARARFSCRSTCSFPRISRKSPIVSITMERPFHHK